MLKHIALTVSKEDDIKTFYKDLLGFSEIRRFTLPENLSHELFGIKDSSEVVLLNLNEIYLEVFLSDRKMEPAYNHICISVQNREDVVKRALSPESRIQYTAPRVVRPSKHDLLFLKDRSGNSFELVESE